MIWNWFSFKFSITFALLVATTLPLIEGSHIHNVEKRQIGVLARTGALPQGKRSVEVLARNGELPPLIGGKKDADNEHTMDLLIHELGTAENLSKLRIQALFERLLEEELDENTAGDFDKRSVSALARNGELPQKRSEIMTRSGYLIKPPQETVQPPTDLLDPDDFLGNAKRGLGYSGNFLLWRKGFALGRNTNRKKNLASLARDGGFSSIKHPLARDEDWDDGFDFDDFHEDKKNVGASKNFGKREIRKNCIDNPDNVAHKGKSLELKSLNVSGKGNARRRKRSLYFDRSQEDFDTPLLEELNELEYEDFPTKFYKNEGAIEKRFLENDVLVFDANRGEFRSWDEYIKKCNLRRHVVDLI